MADWVPDRSLPVLIGQVNAAAPGRSKASDGLVGDQDHQARESDHNPESPPPPGNPDDQVDAADITHDPAHGADMGVVAESIRKSRDRRVRYVIFNRRIFYGYDRAGLPAFTWTAYSGSDPHTGHLHLSVNDIHHDETQLWAIGIGMAFGDAPNEKALINRVDSIIDMDDINPVGDSLKPEPNNLGRAIKAIAADLVAVKEKVDNPPPVALSPEDRAAIVADLLVGLKLPTLEEITAAIGRQDAAGLRAQANMVDSPPPV